MPCYYSIASTAGVEKSEARKNPVTTGPPPKTPAPTRTRMRGLLAGPPNRDTSNLSQARRPARNPRTITSLLVEDKTRLDDQSCMAQALKDLNGKKG